MKRKTGFYIFYFLLLALSGPGAVSRAQENSDCLGCHSDRSLSGTRKGKQISVFVDEKKFTGSMHGSLTCISCHTDLEGKELPHEEDLKPVSCGQCHDKEEKLHASSLHGMAVSRGDPLAPSCSDCHGTHDILSAKDQNAPTSPMKVPFLCGKCHQEGAPV